MWCTTGSILGPLLWIYISDLHKAIQHCKVHQFADDTNFFQTNKSMKNLNKLVNRDMKQLNNWLNAHKISLNVEKTEPVIYTYMPSRHQSLSIVMVSYFSCNKRWFGFIFFSKYLSVTCFLSCSQLWESSQKPQLQYHFLFKVNFDEGFLPPKIIYCLLTQQFWYRLKLFIV